MSKKSEIVLAFVMQVNGMTLNLYIKKCNSYIWFSMNTYYD